MIDQQSSSALVTQEVEFRVHKVGRVLDPQRVANPKGVGLVHGQDVRGKGRVCVKELVSCGV